MVGRPQKRLIYYSQYLDVKSMRVNTREDLENRNLKEYKFMQGLRGIDDDYI
jgi:hypothetical protein